MILGGLGVVLFFNSSAGPSKVSAHVAEYVAMYDAAGGSAQPTGGIPTGRAVIVDGENEKIDALHDKLPAAQRADNHDDVGSIVILLRAGSGLPSASVGLAIASANKGYYNISALVFDRDGTLLTSHAVRKDGAMSGAGEEAQLKAEAEIDMIQWIQNTLAAGG
ncbi:MAG: hypothetical protein D8M59_12635 [Planctomycetes bacterium]|nr:hypothetical protein [Planctomycetota bacterium]